MSRFKIAPPELDQFPLERRKALVESFNASAQTATLRKRLATLAFRVPAVMLILAASVMLVTGNDVGFGHFMLVASLCFAVGVPLGLLCQVLLLRRALRRYIRSYVDAD